MPTILQINDWINILCHQNIYPTDFLQDQGLTFCHLHFPDRRCTFSITFHDPSANVTLIVNCERKGGAPFRGASVEQPDAATTKQNCSASEAPFRGDGGCALHAPSLSTQFGEVVVRRKGSLGVRPAMHEIIEMISSGGRTTRHVYRKTLFVIRNWRLE